MSGPLVAEGAAVSSPMMLSSFLPFILVFLVMYFLVLRPQKQKQKEMSKMLSEIKKGDKVVTQGGLIGVIANLKDDIIVLKVGEGAKLEILRSAIVAVR